jgi:transposase-like protein
MAQVRHGGAQDSQDGIRVLAGRFGINPKTVAKWKRLAMPVIADSGQFPERDPHKHPRGRPRRLGK